MRKGYKNIICILIVAVIIYNIYLAYLPRKIKPLNMKKHGSGSGSCSMNASHNAYLNADDLTNNNSQRFQREQPVVDRLPLVEENTHILPANEIVPMNYKDCNSKKGNVEKELYATDAPLFNEMGPINLVPLDLNDGSHRRINFY